jgi:hypothetical protein
MLSPAVPHLNRPMTSFYPRRNFFCTVDLDVHASVSSEAEFAVLIDGLAPVAFHLERPPGQATFELHQDPVGPGPAILEFVRQIESMPADARAFWDAATRRVFDIGFESGQEPHCPFHANYRLGSDVLAAVTRVRGEIEITMYALDDGKHTPRELLEPDEG